MFWSEDIPLHIWSTILLKNKLLIIQLKKNYLLESQSWKNRNRERARREGGREGERKGLVRESASTHSHPLVHSLYICNGWVEPSQSHKPGTPSRSCTMVAVPKHSGHLPTAFPGTLAGHYSWGRTTAIGTCTHIGCQHHRWQLIPLCHNVHSSSFCLRYFILLKK